MKIGLVDVDGHRFPNLALMKISAYHKADGVEPDKKVEILSDLAETWQNDSDRETFIKMDPVWRDLIDQQDLYIKDLEKLKRRWAALAAFEFLILLIWRFWEW